MDTNKDIHDELEGLSPELSRIRKMQEEPSHHVPENYFEDMPAQMQDYVRNKRRKRSLGWLPSGIGQLAPALAMLLIVVGVAFYFLTKPADNRIATTQDPDTAKTQVAVNTIDEETVLDEMDEDFLVESIAMAEPKKTAKNAGLKTTPQAKEEIEEYILDNFDESVLTEEL
jgi:hypothetical protein